VGGRAARAGHGDVRGRPDRLRVVSDVDRRRGALCGGGAVEAASKLQRPSGDRVKTDAKDALHLARLLRLGEITPVAVPTLEQEAVRDLVRAREDCRGDLMRARHRLSKLLLRQGIVYSGGQAWTGAHDAWLRRQRFDTAATTMAFESDYEAVLAVTARRDRLNRSISQLADASEFTPLVRRLGCLRGISTLTAFALAVEIGDWSRFTGNTIASFVGLVPSEHSSGASRVQGSITKTGNTHARRLLVEAAWHHRAAYRPGKTMHDRWELAPATARQRGDAGNRRLHQRWVTFTLRKKRPVIANVAIARELAGWCWSLAVMDQPSPQTTSSPQTVVAARGATRVSTMSSRPPAGDARP
jgi:transposase